MKLKLGSNLWTELKESLTNSSRHPFGGDYQPSAFDKCIELEEEDFDKAIALAKEWKKSALVKSYQYDKEKYFAEGTLSRSNQPSQFLVTLQSGLAYRKQGNSSEVIRRDVQTAYAKEIAFLDNFKELVSLFRNYNKTIQYYQEAKSKYELAFAQMNKFDEIVKEGISPNEFSWTMIENESKN